jgi:hemin uptake protein HemP
MKLVLPPRPNRSSVPTPSRAPKSEPRQVIKAGSLFGGRREVLIEHAGAHYRLRITQNNKLILTK